MSSTGLDGTVLTPALVDHVTITIYDNQATPVVVFPETTISYTTVVVPATTTTLATTQAYWYFDWNTTGRVPGIYNAKVKIYGLGATPAFVNFEYTQVHLSQPKTA
jgi:hypothetical protein